MLKTTLNRGILLALIAATWLACGDTTPLSPSLETQQAARLTTDILGEEWVLTGFVDSAGTRTSAVTGPRPTLSFQADGTLSGHGGCNGYGGSWSQPEEGALTVGGFFSTLIACEAQGISAQEQRLFRALEQTHSITRTDEVLQVDYGDAGDHLLFELIVREQAAPEPFTSILWQLERFEHLDDDIIFVTDVLPDTRVTAWFEEDGTARGSAGCNDWGGRWVQDGSETLTLDELASTEMACLDPEGVMAQETRFLDALTQISRVTSIPDELWLRSADGTIGLALTRSTQVGDIVAIRGGTSFGHCLGYCWEATRLSTDGFNLTKGGWDVVAFPEIDVTEDFDPELWRRLIGMPDIDALFRLDEVIGCPDCADGGAEFIEVETTTGRRRVTFEYGRAPREVADLAQLLQSQRDRLRQRFEIATVILE